MGTNYYSFFFFNSIFSQLGHLPIPPHKLALAYYRTATKWGEWRLAHVSSEVFFELLLHHKVAKYTWGKWWLHSYAKMSSQMASNLCWVTDYSDWFCCLGLPATGGCGAVGSQSCDVQVIGCTLFFSSSTTATLVSLQTEAAVKIVILIAGKCKVTCFFSFFFCVGMRPQVKLLIFHSLLF